MHVLGLPQPVKAILFPEVGKKCLDINVGILKGTSSHTSHFTSPVSHFSMTKGLKEEISANMEIRQGTHTVEGEGETS